MTSSGAVVFVQVELAMGLIAAGEAAAVVVEAINMHISATELPSIARRRMLSMDAIPVAIVSVVIGDPESIVIPCAILVVGLAADMFMLLEPIDMPDSGCGRHCTRPFPLARRLSTLFGYMPVLM